MALTKCPECGKEVSDKAKVCPNCGVTLRIVSQDEIKNAVEKRPRNALACFSVLISITDWIIIYVYGNMINDGKISATNYSFGTFMIVILAILPIIGLVMGIVSNKKAKHGASGRVLSKIGMILSITALLPYALLIFEL